MGFRGATRGQSEVVGAILIFAIIVAFIGINQAFLVPQANEDVEFKHSNDVQRDIVELRSGTIEAAASNEPSSRTIALGTDYPSRFVTINPPSPTGTIRTVEGDGGIHVSHEDVDLSAVCGTDSDEPTTKHLAYTPNYNEYRNSLPLILENTVAYRQADGKAIFNTGQLFTQGSQINVVRYVGDIEETSSGTASLDLIPSSTGTTTVDASDGDLTITLPSRLEVGEWNQLLNNQPVSPEEVSENDRERVKFNFEEGTYTVRCTTIGINEEPEADPKTASDSNDGRNLINPNSGDIVLVNTSDIQGNGEEDVTISLEDRTEGDETVEIVGARLNFYSSTSTGHSPGYESFMTLGGRNYAPGGEFKYFEPGEEIPLDEEPEEVTLEFGENVQDDDFYVLSLEFSNGDANLYFVSHVSDDQSGT